MTDQIAIKLLAGPQLISRAQLASALASLDAEIKVAEASVDEEEGPHEDTPTYAEIKKMKSERTKSKKLLKAIDTSLLDTARQTLAAMSEAESPDEAIGVLRSRLEKLVIDHNATVERGSVTWYDNLVKKYGRTLHQLDAARVASAAGLRTHLIQLGYE